MGWSAMWSSLVLSSLFLASAPQEWLAELPVFSRAGYRAGAALPERAPTIDAREYRALAGDGEVDGPALQAALDAAAAAGGGVAHLPRNDGGTKPDPAAPNGSDPPAGGAPPAGA